MSHSSRDDELFTRGPQTVRMVREFGSSGSCRLLVYGPGTEIVIYDFSDVADCMKRQAEIEYRLIGGGYDRDRRSSNRRYEYGIWSGADQRRSSN